MYAKFISPIIIQALTLSAVWPSCVDSLIITSVLAGDKKFKTISFDTKFIKPLTFEKEMPTTEFRRHRTVRPPKFDVDVNIPIKLPLEEEYPQPEYKKPVTSDFFLQTDEINEHNPSYNKMPSYQTYRNQPRNELVYASSEKQPQLITNSMRTDSRQAQSARGSIDPMESQATSMLAFPSFQTANQQQLQRPDPRSDEKSFQPMIQPSQHMAQPMMSVRSDRASAGYGAQNNGYPPQEFVPGGFVNLQLSGPSGGPKMTYGDYDRERWAQQLSQTHSAMPFPILNYQQLQNFYGGLGTFTNGLPDSTYTSESMLDLIKSKMSHIVSKLHRG